MPRWLWLLIGLPILFFPCGALANSNPYNFYNELSGSAVSVAAACHQDGCTVSPSNLILPTQAANHITVTSNITNVNVVSLSFNATFTVTEDDANIQICTITVPITIPPFGSTAQFGPPSVKVNSAQSSWSCVESAGVLHVVAKSSGAKGNTQVAVSPELAATLGTLGIELAALPPARLRLARGQGVARFPITRGDLDLDQLDGEIGHRGGLSLTAGGVTVSLSSFSVELTQTDPRVTGLMVANGTVFGPLPLFKLDLSGASTRVRGHKLKLLDAGVSLTAEAADELNLAFGTTAFSEDLLIGTVDIEVHGLRGLK